MHRGGSSARSDALQTREKSTVFLVRFRISSAPRQPVLKEQGCGSSALHCIRDTVP